MKSLYLLVLTLMISVVSCRTKDGVPGPAGESSLTQQGFISGTITYRNDSGNNVEAPFNYSYFESLSDNKFYYYDEDEEYYEIDFGRRDQKDDYNQIWFDMSGYSDLGVESDPSSSSIDFSFVGLVDNKLVEFYGYTPTITNLSLDPATGRLTFDYTCLVYSNNGGNNGTARGKVDVILNRSPRSAR